MGRMNTGLFAAGALALLLAPACARAQAADPIAAVQTLDAGLLASMKAGARSGLRGREAALGPVIDRTFDIPLMTRLAVGTAWNGIAAADQQALVAAFRRLTVAQLAANFDSYSGQSFAVNPQVDARGGDRLVRTTLNNPKGGAEALSYRLRQSGGGWRIIDVFYRNAISQLATRRSDFAGVLASGGAHALVQHLDALAAKAGD